MSGWQPIATAPKGEFQPFLGGIVREEAMYIIDQYVEDHGYYVSELGHVPITHWQPLPEPPR